MTGHTKGPWKAVRNTCYWEIQSEQHGQIADTCASNFLYINGRQISERDAEVIAAANARLIAAAPVLLAALERVVSMYEHATGLPMPSQASRAIHLAKHASNNEEAV